MTGRLTLFSFRAVVNVVVLGVRVGASRGTLDGGLRGGCCGGLANSALILSPCIAFNGDTVNKSATNTSRIAIQLTTETKLHSSKLSKTEEGKNESW